jgi:3-oxoacyl-[acyl-carrier protein] reductase
MSQDLSGKVALVAASSRGIGFGVAQALHQAGASVCLCARGQAALDAAVSELKSGGNNRVMAVAGDLSQPAFPSDLADAVRRGFGTPVDILITNNGGPPSGNIETLGEDLWLSAIQANLLSVVRLCAAVLPSMKTRGWGRIINLTSTTAREPVPGMGLSNVTRAAVAAYAKTLAHEVGPFGITVNTVLTGGVLTDRLNTLLGKRVEGTGETIEQAIAGIEGTIPVRHIAAPDEFARTVLFLASPDSSYLTGAAIPVDGGSSRSIF